MPVVDPHHQRSQAASLPIRMIMIMMYGSETWAAPSKVMERLDCTKRKLLRRLLGYFWRRETSRSPCSTSFEEFVGFKLEEANWPKAEDLGLNDERGHEDTRRGYAECS
ncbi:hypothetical protein RB195_005752 [Necator americanus]|uniref:Uncharacterized protein n=1 Tax=Necator americanus TaxID=51031 RepID=A0ABR1BT73_NECAM